MLAKLAERRLYGKEPIATSGTDWGKKPPSSYQDVPNETNLAPLGKGGNYTSSRDPMAAMGSDAEFDTNDTTVFLGPPQDEDGNELKEVNII